MSKKAGRKKKAALEIFEEIFLQKSPYVWQK